MNQDVRETGFYDALGCLVIRLDRQANIWFMNHFALTLLGYERLGQIFGKPLHAILPIDEVKSIELLGTIKALAHQAAPNPVESDLLRFDGTRIPVSWNITHEDGEKSRVAPTILIGFDASSIRKSQAAATMFQTVSDNFSGSIIITDPERNILYANPSLLEMTGYSLPEVLGQTPSLFKSGQTADEVYKNLWTTLAAGEIWRGEFLNRRHDGEQYLESKTISAIRDTQGRIQYYFAIGEDISQRQHYQRRIENLLAFDQLTGLPNRSAFLASLVAVLAGARQEGMEVTVLYADVDNFFTVNESVNASEADQVIIEIASRIKATLRQADRLARAGNDKFSLVLGPHEAGIDNDISEVAERVLQAIRQPIVLADKTIHVTMSIGTACFPNDGDSAEELLNHAMSATERAKKNGGDAFFRFDASSALNDNGRRDLLKELRLAIEREELVLHYQPQVSLFSGAIIGLEALIRWQHPQRGLIMPGEFIPLAEESGLVISIGDWVLREVCRQMRAWLDTDLSAVKVAINLSARHFLVPGLHVAIADVLDRARIEPKFLEIEITEGAMMQDVTGAIRSMTQLKEIGVRISLDDFGTGYSSLAYLSRFPIDVVKIDQSFVSDITSNPINAAIAQATIAMSHKLGKIVLAEGVETEEQMQYLRRNECDEMQGYFFSKPLPAKSIADLLRAGQVMNLYGQSRSETRSTVLFVDDEANILNSLKRTLRREGYAILTAESATDAFSLLARNTVQVIVSDQRMPGMNGTEFLSRVKSLYPETVRMVLSGYSEITSVTDSINKGAVYRFLMKPWDDETMKAEIIGALRHWRELYGGQGVADET